MRKGFRKAFSGGGTVRGLYMAFIFLFLYAPVVVLVVFSFNAAKSRSVWGGFTLEWYQKLFTNTEILSSLRVTLIVALLSSIVATLVATVTCIGLDGLGKRRRAFVMNLTYVPIVNPDLVTGISLMLLFVFMQFQLGFVTLLLAHIAFNIPYAILSILPKMRQLDRNLYEAALDLGAKPTQAMVRVILPEIMPGVVTALILTFTLSIDDFVISYFTSGAGVSNLAITIYSMARKSVNPQINALSALMFVVVLALLLIVNFRSNREMRKPKEEKSR